MTINDKVRRRFGRPTEIGSTVSANETLSGILDRRSRRHFTAASVTDDLLQTLLAAAFSAPSKSDLQQACVIHVRERSKLERIAASSEKVQWITRAPVFLVWCGDSRRIRRLAAWREHPFANDHLDAFMNAAVDAGIAMQTFIIAAESVGLGCCPVSEVRDHIDVLSRELSLPEWVFPVAGLCVGWPTGESRVSMRLPLETTVKVDTYDDTHLFDEVADYDRRREAAEPTPPESQRLADEFGVAVEYGWSENRTRQYSKPARADFGRYVRRQGFDLS